MNYESNFILIHKLLPSLFCKSVLAHTCSKYKYVFQFMRIVVNV